LPDGQWLARPDTGEPTLELLERIGRVPLPPYIRDGEMVDADRENYQTVYAQKPGAVAAPTAGLHFTKDLLNRVRDHGVQIEYVTLHVGLGTFRPVSVQRLSDHQMHSEWASLDAGTADRLNRARADGGRLIAVGTTVVRTLETIATRDRCRLGKARRICSSGLRTSFGRWMLDDQFPSAQEYAAGFGAHFRRRRPDPAGL
jgi:S-adenosylmethionine:tRNA ribosyltransferase-isomerase